MTNEKARDVLNEQIAKYGQEYDADGIEALIMGIKALEKQENNFNEVVDFFNDIMNTFHKELSLYDVSTESVRYARNVVYDVFSRRYRIKEIENGKSETIQEV